MLLNVWGAPRRVGWRLSLLPPPCPAPPPPLSPLPPRLPPFCPPAGRLPSIRRNVLQAVYLFDPASPAALDICALVFQIELQSWPLRMGLVPVVPSRVARARGDAGAPRQRLLQGRDGGAGGRRRWSTAKRHVQFGL